MTHRVHNFSAGPGALPVEVLQQDVAPAPEEGFCMPSLMRQCP